jgi:hypothetical protein
LRGKGLGSGTYGSYSHATLGGEDDIFTQFTGGDSGLVITSKPITGLTVGFSVKNMLANDITAFHKTNNDNGNRAGDIALASKAGEVWGKFHLAAGYDISGIGLARVGFLAANKATHQNSWTGANAKGIPYSTGGTTDAEKSYWSSYAFPTGNLIQAAFNLTAVENLTLDFGFGLPIAYKVGYNPQEGVSTQFWKYSLPKNADGTASTTLPDGSLPGGVNASLLDGAMYYDTDVEFQAPLNVSLATEYVFGDFGARLRSDLYFGGSIKIDEKQDIPVTFDLHLHPFYNIPNIGKVGLEFGFNAYGPVTMKSQGPGSTDVDLDGGIQTLAFGGWFQKTLAGGTFRVGLAYSIPLEPVESYTGPTTKETNYKKDEQKSPGIFTIPVTFDYSF